MARKKGKTYSQTVGNSNNGKYMISEDMSAPSNMPRESKSVMYPYVDCGGVYAGDSVDMSDRVSSNMAKKMRDQLIKDTIF